jgi:hypothetical protein
MKRSFDIIKVIIALVVVPGSLIVAALFLLAKLCGFKIDKDKLISSIWKRR